MVVFRILRPVRFLVPDGHVQVDDAGFLSRILGGNRCEITLPAFITDLVIECPLGCQRLDQLADDVREIRVPRAERDGRVGGAGKVAHAISRLAEVFDEGVVRLEKNVVLDFLRRELCKGICQHARDALLCLFVPRAILPHHILDEIAADEQKREHDAARQDQNRAVPVRCLSRSGRRPGRKRHGVSAKSISKIVAREAAKVGSG
ncbi:MAG: hypothetical protein BWY66_02446 [bacterium ADurb.Bin374]|nr:MAG: hypothetical protein BWY66_02446 [bacterium ADurb.Bin374]